MRVVGKNGTINGGKNASPKTHYDSYYPHHRNGGSPHGGIKKGNSSPSSSPTTGRAGKRTITKAMMARCVHVYLRGRNGVWLLATFVSILVLTTYHLLHATFRFPTVPTMNYEDLASFLKSNNESSSSLPEWHPTTTNTTHAMVTEKNRAMIETPPEQGSNNATNNWFLPPPFYANANAEDISSSEEQQQQQDDDGVSGSEEQQQLQQQLQQLQQHEDDDDNVSSSEQQQQQQQEQNGVGLSSSDISATRLVPPVRQCSSPEANVNWIFQGCDSTTTTTSSYATTTSNNSTVVVGHSATSSSHTTCGLCRQNAFTDFLSQVTEDTQTALERHCKAMVLYSVQFGPIQDRRTWSLVSPTVEQELPHEIVHRCAVLFVLEGQEIRLEPIYTHDSQASSASSSARNATLFKHERHKMALRIVVPPHLLPYKSMRRNVKLIKLHSHQIFSWTERLIYVDNKLRRRGISMKYYQEYYQNTIERHQGVCVAAMAAPVHNLVLGDKASAALERGDKHINHQDHCEAVMGFSKPRPYVTDDSNTLLEQCKAYQKDNDNDSSSSSFLSLNDGMIDSGLMVWNLQTDHCRQFIADLTCTWSDEIACYSDRDEISFAQALRYMNLQHVQQQDDDDDDGNDELDTTTRDVVFVKRHETTSRSLSSSSSELEVSQQQQQQQPMVALIQSRCHWYHGTGPFSCEFNPGPDLRKKEVERAMTTTTIAKDTRKCLSPEVNVSWAYDGCAPSGGETDAAAVVGGIVGRSAASPKTCGLCQQNTFTKYLRHVAVDAQTALQHTCKNLLLLSVQFGYKTHRRTWSLVSREEEEKLPSKVVNECSILFILEGQEVRLDPVLKDAPIGRNTTLFRHERHRMALRVVIPEHVLPYESPRRNAKLIKLHAHQIFPWAQRIVWTDNKLRRDGLQMHYFQDYFTRTVEQKDVCVAFLAAPVHAIVVGLDAEESTAEKRPKYWDHCKTIAAASTSRASVTDGADVLLRQCRTYREMTNSTAVYGALSLDGRPTYPARSKLQLDDGMIDSALIAWNLQTDRCREFVADLTCTWSDETACYSDRDEISFPQTLRVMKMREQDNQPVLDTTSRDVIYVHDVQAASGDSQDGGDTRPLIALIQSRCHWYHQNGPLTCELVSSNDTLPAQGHEQEEPENQQEQVFVPQMFPRPGPAVSSTSSSSSSSITTTALSSSTTKTTASSSLVSSRRCLSPESDVSWKFGGCPAGPLPPTAGGRPALVGKSATSTNTCGLCGQSNKFIKFLQKVANDAQEALEDKCKDMLLYSVQLGYKQSRRTWSLVSKEAEIVNPFKVANDCAILFILEGQEVRVNPYLEHKSYNDTTLFRHERHKQALRVLVPPEVLPYQSMRRNVKLIKLHAHQIFPWTDRLIWTDNKLRRDSVSMKYFGEFFNNTIDKNNVCVAFMAAPVHHLFVGMEAEEGVLDQRPKFWDHCKNIAATAKSKSSVTDAADVILQQCHAYQGLSNTSEINGAQQAKQPTLQLDDGMIESGLIVWDLRSEECREFNANLGCTWGDETQCFSDRDEISFPQALRYMGLREENNEPVRDTTSRNVIYVEDKKDFLFFGSAKPRVALIQSRCHWYHQTGPLTCKLQENALQLQDNPASSLLDGETRDCLSPEADVEWTYDGCKAPEIESPFDPVIGRSATSKATCGLCEQNAFTKFMKRVSEDVRETLESDCQDLLLYSVQFGPKTRHTDIRTIAKDIEKQYNKEVMMNECSILFVLEGYEDGLELVSDDVETLYRKASVANTTLLLDKQAFGHDSVTILDTLEDLTIVVDKPDLHVHNLTRSTVRVGDATLKVDAWSYRVVVPASVLPYKGLRRNVKLIKMHGHQIFNWVDRLMWVDNKLQRGAPMEIYQDFFENAVERNNVCVAFMAAPVHISVVGLSAEKGADQRPKYLDHCRAVVEASLQRPTVTDGTEALSGQCLAYQDVTSVQGARYDEPMSPSLLLDDSLIDSALISWDLRSDRCRQFNADLGCTWGDEIQCYSDRDQVAFPHTLRFLGLQEEHNRPIVDTSSQNTIFVASDTKLPTVALIQSDCHWYHRMGSLTCGLIKPSGGNRTTQDDLLGVDDRESAIEEEQQPRKSASAKRVAVLVAGNLQRYMFSSTIKHLIKPLVAQNHTVDYYLSLTTAYVKPILKERSYTFRVHWDPIFTKNQVVERSPNPALVEQLIRMKLEAAGARVGTLMLRKTVDIDSNPFIQEKRAKARAAYPDEDPDLRFPVFDMRSRSIIRRMAILNREMLRLHLAVEELWEATQAAEEMGSFNYDYVLFLSDDSLWLADFDLNHLTREQADVYSLSCDARDPPMALQEMNDYAIVANRLAADTFGYFFTKLFGVDIEACADLLPNHFRSSGQRGCNGGMILRNAVEENDLSLREVGQAEIPFQRSLNLIDDDLSIIQCFDKFCQSRECSLDVGKYKKCRDHVFFNAATGRV